MQHLYVHYICVDLFNFCTYFFTQTIAGITLAQYNSEPNSGLTVQQTVAAAVGFNVHAQNVEITSVFNGTVPGLLAPGVTLAYTITAPTAPFSSPTAAATAYSTALTTSVASGLFASTLKAQAALTGAKYMAGILAVPQQANVQTVSFSSPTLVPTAAPYSAGSPTPIPSAVPTPSPTYGAGNPTPQPTMVPTLPPVSVYTVQVCSCSSQVAKYQIKILLSCFAVVDCVVDLINSFHCVIIIYFCRFLWVSRQVC